MSCTCKADPEFETRQQVTCSFKKQRQYNKKSKFKQTAAGDVKYFIAYTDQKYRTQTYYRTISLNIIKTHTHKSNL